MSPGDFMTAPTVQFDGFLAAEIDDCWYSAFVSIRIDGEVATITGASLDRPNEPLTPVLRTTDRYETRIIRSLFATMEPQRREFVRERLPTSRPVNPRHEPSQGRVDPITCPDCRGYQSYDCDTCKGSGFVPDFE